MQTALEVKTLGVSGTELHKKIYFQKWVNELPEAKKILMSVEELREDLSIFIKQLKIEENEQVQQDPVL